jgi:hypothetical protein
MEPIKEKPEEKSEQNNSSNSDLQIKPEDQKAYRQMTDASAAAKTLPVLFIEKSEKHAAPAKTKDEQYKEQETKRVEDYAKKHIDGTRVDQSKLVIGALPQDIAITTKPGQLKIESNDFTKVAEAVPGAYLDPTLRKLLGSLKSATVDGATVKVEAEAKVPVEVSKNLPNAELTIKNPSFKIVPDASNPNRINLENIKGVSIGLLGIGGDLKQASITLVTDGNGKKAVQIEIPKPEAKKPDPNDILGRLGRAANGLALPEKTTITLPLDNPDTAKLVERIFDSVKGWAKEPDKHSPADLAASIAGVDLKSALGGALDNITSVSKKGELLEIARSKASTNDLGGLPVELAQTIKGKIENKGGGLGISQIEGIAMNLPVPAEVAKAIGLPQPFKANLKEVSIGDADKDGNRILTVKTDSLLESVQIKVNKDFKPVTDDKGNISLDLNVKLKDVNLPLSVTFNPEQVAKPPANGPDFKISLKGDANCVKLIEKMTGTTVDAPLKDMISNVTSISKVGDRVSIEREKSSSHDLGGVILDAGKNIKFKLTQDGPSGARLSNIEGIHLKLPVQLPQMVKDLGIDPGNHIYTNLKTFALSSPDGKGNRKLLLETDHLMKQVGVMLGPDMKPALDPKGNWYMYGFVDNPVANKQMPLVLRFDKGNQLAMSTQELMRIGSQAAWQATDNGGVEGVGFGVIAVATEAGALALDVKDKVVEGATVVKDVVVEGAGIVKDKVVEGASTVGGWVRDGWNWIWD